MLVRGIRRLIGVLAVLGLATVLSATVGASVSGAEGPCKRDPGRGLDCCEHDKGSTQAAVTEGGYDDDCPVVVGPQPVVPPLFCDGDLVTVNLAQGQSPTQNSDVIAGTPGADFIGGLGGDDTICALGGLDWVTGGPGNDTIFGSLGNDLMAGNGGDDEMDGLSGNDTMNGGAGDDDMDGGSGADTCNGNGGTDTATDCQTTTGVP